LGPIARRPVLRENRRLPRAKMNRQVGSV
jgi:hypothetical protein